MRDRGIALVGCASLPKLHVTRLVEERLLGPWCEPRGFNAKSAKEVGEADWGLLSPLHDLVDPRGWYGNCHDQVTPRVRRFLSRSRTTPIEPADIEKTLGSKIELVVPGLASDRGAALGKRSRPRRLCLILSQECS